MDLLQIRVSFPNSIPLLLVRLAYRHSGPRKRLCGAAVELVLYSSHPPSPFDLQSSGLYPQHGGCGQGACSCQPYWTKAVLHHPKKTPCPLSPVVLQGTDLKGITGQGGGRWKANDLSLESILC